MILLILNGRIPLPKLVRSVGASADTILCTDGAVTHCLQLKLRPRLVIGDMDSLPKKVPAWKETTYFCDFDEDASDFEKALRLIANPEGRAYKKMRNLRPDDPELFIAGALGGRTDHIFVNLSLIEKYSQVLRITLIDAGLARLLGPGKYSFRCNKGQLFSLSPAPKAVLSTRGLKYPLRKQTLVSGSRGLSNPAGGDKVDIDVHEGKVWIVSPTRS
jgi:thiamine pyrophosphokinase